MAKPVKARLSDIGNALADGGFVRFVWKTGSQTLHWPNGSVWSLDGRSYASVRDDARLKRMESGNLEEGTLVIEWRA